MSYIVGMKIKTGLVVLALSCISVLAEDEDTESEETQKVANALSNAKGVTYKLDNKSVLTDKGLVYRLDNNTYVGPDGIYTRLGKDWVTPSGYASESGRGNYFGHGNGSSIKSGNGWVTGNGYNYTSR